LAPARARGVPTVSAPAQAVPQDLFTANHEKTQQESGEDGLSAVANSCRLAVFSWRSTRRTTYLPKRSAALQSEKETPMDGFITVPSLYGPKETMDRLETEVRAKGMHVFLRIDHAAGASAAGLDLRPTEVLLLGNPQAGTKLMQQTQTIGLELPLKVLVWQDASGKTWLGYDEPRWLATRFRIAEQTTAVTDAMTSGLAALAKQATGN